MAEILLWPHIPAMRKKLSKWRITRIRGNRADQLGTVEADDAATAIQVAIKKYDVDERDRSRIAAMPDNYAARLPR